VVADACPSIEVGEEHGADDGGPASSRTNLLVERWYRPTLVSCDHH